MRNGRGDVVGGKMSVATESADFRRFLPLILTVVFVALTAPVQAQSDDPAAHEPQPVTAPAAEQSVDQAAAEPPGTSVSVNSGLVAAARKNRAANGGEKARVSLTNKDVKNSKGKLTLISSSKLPEEKTAVAVAVEKPDTTKSSAKAVSSASVVEKKPADPKKVALAELRLEKASRDVADLERELARNEQQYYSEDDASYRDQVIRPRFDRTRIQLENAREELSAARDDLQRYQ